MTESIATIILIVSFSGIGIFLFRKIPALLRLPETAPSYFNWPGFFKKIKTLNIFKDFSSELFLQKVLSKVRILTLKTDHKTSNWLQRLRERSQKKKFEENGDYWQEVKKIKNEK